MPDSDQCKQESLPAPGPRPCTSKILFERYEIGRLLGVGAFAKVYHARHILSNYSVAIKVISKLKAVRGNLSVNIRREIHAMRLLRHPHIIHLLEVLASRSRIYFVMEYAKGGELFSYLSCRGRLPEDLSRRLFHQLVSAVAFSHSRGVFHRDLKPENLLLDDSHNLKVSDFGLSAVVPDPGVLLKTICGTPAYVAPEILSKKGYSGAEVDIWSCGVILFVLNAGFLPFNDPNLMAMYRKIYSGEYRCPKWTSPDLRRLISRLLDTNPATRITIEGILNDPWFRKGLDEEKMRRLMRFREDVEERISELENCAAQDEERDLNAFDIISMSARLDLSGFFNPLAAAARDWFVVGESVAAVLERVEEVGRREGMVVRRRRRGEKGRGCVAVEGRCGSLVAWVEVLPLSPVLVMVKVERGSDEEAERLSSGFWRERLAARIRGSAGDHPTPSPSPSVASAQLLNERHNGNTCWISDNDGGERAELISIFGEGTKMSDSDTEATPATTKEVAPV